jgi:hypothetical protein
LLVERRASPPGWTGETPVPPPYDLPEAAPSNLKRIL